MLNNQTIISIISIIFSACYVDNAEKITHKNMEEQPKVAVTADAETTPVNSNDDAADDPCIWVNPNDILKSTIIGTDKKEGLDVYNLDGKRLYSYKVGRVNNVDLRDNFDLSGQNVTVVTASNRTYNTISIFIVKNTGELEDVASRPIKSKLKEVYGLGMYKSPENQKIYVFVVGKSGGVEQWELFAVKYKIDAKLVRSFHLGSKGEGIVADDKYQKVYIGEENKALWKYNAEPNSNTERIKVISTKDLNMKADFEGVTIYDSGNGKGHVILSSQGNNSYVVFDRITNQYQGTFSIKDGDIDGTNDTDGIDVTSISFGDKYPSGFFLAQDGNNTDSETTLYQNFKIVDWRKISKNLNLK